MYFSKWSIVLILVLRNLDINCFENTIDPDQLASGKAF